MSRAYRIRVKESLKRVVRAHDKVGTQLEILEVLPSEQMADLLRKALREGGFQDDGEQLVRRDKGVTVRINPQTGELTVESEQSRKVALEGEREARSYAEAGAHANKLKKDLKDQLRVDLEKQAKEREEELQKEVTDRLEGELSDLRRELDQVVNRVTAEALKQKASQLGQIKELTEDPRTGSLTIVLEV